MSDVLHLGPDMQAQIFVLTWASGARKWDMVDLNMS